MSDDLAAIFGPGVRTSDDASAARRLAGPGLDRRRHAIVAIAAGALAAAVAAGVFAGTNAAGGLAGVQTPIVGRRASQYVHDPERHAIRAATDLAATAASPPSAPVPAPITIHEAVTTSPAPRPSAPVRPPAPSSATPRLSPATFRKMASAVPPVPDPRDEEEGYSGFASRLDAAERRLADAYDQAMAAGVRPAILRGYRHEWDRARREAADRPRAALRLYAMMTSDFYNLADDPDALADGYPR